MKKLELAFIEAFKAYDNKTQDKSGSNAPKWCFYSGVINNELQFNSTQSMKVYFTIPLTEFNASDVQLIENNYDKIFQHFRSLKYSLQLV